MIKEANEIVEKQKHKLYKNSLKCIAKGHDLHQVEVIKAGAVYKMRCDRCYKQYMFYQQLEILTPVPKKKVKNYMEIARKRK